MLLQTISISIGQINNFISSLYTENNITSILGTIVDNKLNSMYRELIINQPQNNVFYVTKTNNNNEYILVLTFEKLDEIKYSNSIYDLYNNS